MPSYFHRTIDVYGADIYVATDKRQWGALRRKFKELPAAETYGITTQVNDGNGIVLVMFIAKADLPDRLSRVQVCAHEAAHAAMFLFHEIGEEIVNSSEPFAYLSGWLTALLVDLSD